MQEWRLTPEPASRKFEAAGPQRANAGLRIKCTRFPIAGRQLPQAAGLQGILRMAEFGAHMVR